jgi:hypothetical protein
MYVVFAVLSVTSTNVCVSGVNSGLPFTPGFIVALTILTFTVCTLLDADDKGRLARGTPIELLGPGAVVNEATLLGSLSVKGQPSTDSLVMVSPTSGLKRNLLLSGVGKNALCPGASSLNHTVDGSSY